MVYTVSRESSGLLKRRGDDTLDLACAPEAKKNRDIESYKAQLFHLTADFLFNRDLTIEQILSRYNELSKLTITHNGRQCFFPEQIIRNQICSTLQDLDFLEYLNNDLKHTLLRDTNSWLEEPCQRLPDLDDEGKDVFYCWESILKDAIDILACPFMANTNADSSHSTVPVLVVGAGPVGLKTTLELAKLGFAVDLFEKRPAASAASRYNILSAKAVKDGGRLSKYEAHQILPTDRGQKYEIGKLQRFYLKIALVYGVNIKFGCEIINSLCEFNLENQGITKVRYSLDSSRGSQLEKEYNLVVGAGGFRDPIKSGLFAKFKHTDLMLDESVAPDISKEKLGIQTPEICDTLITLKMRIPKTNFAQHQFDVTKIQSMITKVVSDSKGINTTQVFKRDGFKCFAAEGDDFVYCLATVNGDVSISLLEKDWSKDTDKNYLDIKAEEYMELIFPNLCQNASAQMFQTRLTKVSTKFLSLGALNEVYFVGDAVSTPAWPQGEGLAKGYDDVKRLLSQIRVKLLQRNPIAWLNELQRCYLEYYTHSKTNAETFVQDELKTLLDDILFELDEQKLNYLRTIVESANANKWDIGNVFKIQGALFRNIEQLVAQIQTDDVLEHQLQLYLSAYKCFTQSYDQEKLVKERRSAFSKIYRMEKQIKKAIAMLESKDNDRATPSESTLVSRLSQLLL